MGFRDKGRIRRRILALSRLVPLLVSLPAAAQSRDYGPFDAVGGGLFIGYTFGDEHGIDWGIEGFATRHFQWQPECGDNSERHGFGPLVRLSALNVSRIAITGAGHVGGELSRSYLAGDLELGGTLTFRGDRALGSVHSGVTLESIIFNVYARQDWMLHRYSVGGGARFMPTFGLPGFCEVGRAFRDAAGAAQSCPALSHTRADPVQPDAARWRERTSDECASVLAFLQLALELLDLDAPPELFQRALCSAEQELTHTWAAAALATRFGGASVVPRAPRASFRAPLPRRQQLERLVRESWVDGCLNEGLAALVASEEARETRDDLEARVSSLIALDEAEHAALALDVVRWALDQDRSLASLCAAGQRPAPFKSSLLRPAQLEELASTRAELLERV